jgi:hypothetical protein
LATSTERRSRKKMKKVVSKKEMVVVAKVVEVAAMVVVLAERAEEVAVLRVEWEEGIVVGEGVEVAEEEVVTLVQQRKVQRKILPHHPLPAHLPLRPLHPSHVPLHRDPRQQPR